MSSVKRIEYQLSRETRALINDMLALKKKDITEYFETLSEIKKDLGLEFYNKYLKDSLEPLL